MNIGGRNLAASGFLKDMNIGGRNLAAAGFPKDTSIGGRKFQNYFTEMFYSRLSNLFKPCWSVNKIGQNVVVLVYILRLYIYGKFFTETAGQKKFKALSSYVLFLCYY
jgi:hypothetical protein